MKKIIKLAVAGLTLGCSCLAQAAIIQNTWTANVSSITDKGSYFSANVGDSVSFTVTYDDSLHSMVYYDIAGNIVDKYCDRTAVTNMIYTDCTQNSTDYALFADNISNSFWNAMSTLVGGIDVDNDVKAYDWSYRYDANDTNTTNDSSVFSSYIHNGSFGAMYMYDPSSSSPNDGYADLYGIVNGTSTHLGEVFFNNLNMSSSVSNPVSAPAGVAILGLGLLGLALCRRVRI